MRVAASQRGFIEVDDLNTIEDFLSDINITKRQLTKGTDLLARVLAYINLGIAQKMSAGPVDPMQRMPGAAWQIPVRRISGEYYAGWRVHRASVGIWELRNDSREAVAIEYGLGNSTDKIRRPIQKISLLQTLRKAESSRAYDRIWLATFGALAGKRTFVGKMPDPLFGGPG